MPQAKLFKRAHVWASNMTISYQFLSVYKDTNSNTKITKTPKIEKGFTIF